MLYSTDGAGRWWRSGHARQCPYEMLWGRRCQGAEGHAGDHWCYAPSGDYEAAPQEVNGDHDIAYRMTPPGHPTWVSPADCRPLYFIAVGVVREEVTDPRLLDLLERCRADDPAACEAMNAMHPEGFGMAGPVGLTE